MKKEFGSYYPPDDGFFTELWDEALIILDANILCNLYRYDKSTRNEFLMILKELKERLWLPHQSALEYQRNRLNEILNQKEKISNLKQIVQDAERKFNEEINKFGKQFPYFDISNIKKAGKDSFSNIKLKIQELDENEPNLLENDTILDEITELYSDRVGKKFEVTHELEIYEEGEKRYSSLIPPGYKDASNKKGIHRFGDLILWFQIIEKARKARCPIIFVTDDRKEDWWCIIKDQNFGPKPELIAELNDKAQVNFHMYTSVDFLKCASRYKKKILASATIKEVESVQQERTYPHLNQALLNSIKNLQRILNTLPLAEIINAQYEIAKLVQTQENQREQLLASINKFLSPDYSLPWPYVNYPSKIPDSSEEEKSMKANDDEPDEEG